MQHVDRIGKGGDVYHAECSCRIADSNFSDAMADVAHRLPMVRLEPALNSVKLKTCIAPRAIGNERIVSSESPRKTTGFIYLYQF
jgi:hypothetical protein